MSTARGKGESDSAGVHEQAAAQACSGRHAGLRLVKRRCLVQVLRMNIPALDCGILEHPGQESEIGRQTKQRRAPHGITHLPQRSGAVLTPNHQLRHHGVIEGGDAVPVSHPGLDPHALRPSHARYAARRRPEAFYRILRIDSAFDRATRGLDLRLRQGQGTARGNLKLPCDQILASDFFRNRVLDLQARIYFQEVKIVLLINDEFERSRVYISDTASASQRRIVRPHPDSSGNPIAGASSTSF